MRHNIRCPGDISETAQVENILRATNKLFSLENHRSLAISHLDVERNSFNNGNVNQDIIELKILLLKLKQILIEADGSRDRDGGDENCECQSRIRELQLQLSDKETKIRGLEEVLGLHRSSSSRQLPPARPMGQPGQLGREAWPRQEPPPCNHAWGPCANDHSHHHARRRGRPRPRLMARSLSGRRTSRTRESRMMESG